MWLNVPFYCWRTLFLMQPTLQPWNTWTFIHGDSRLVLTFSSFRSFFLRRCFLLSSFNSLLPERSLCTLTLFFFLSIQEINVSKSSHLSLVQSLVPALTNSFSLCAVHESSSSGRTPWKPLNLVQRCFHQPELSLHWQWVNHQRHSLYYSPLKSFWISMPHKDCARPAQ